MNIGLELSFIMGFSVGFELHEKGKIDEDIGYLVIDLGILRLLFMYQ